MYHFDLKIEIKSSIRNKVDYFKNKKRVFDSVESTLSLDKWDI